MITDLIKIKRRIWNGTINIRIVLQLKNDAIEYLLTINRNSYFPIHYQQLIDYFNKFTTLTNTVWLEFEDVPIKWHLPAGVLHDNLFLPTRSNRKVNDDHVWTLNLKADSSYPSEHIIPFVNDYETMFTQILINQLKQSCFVLNGNSKPIMVLSEADTNLYLKSILTRNLNQYNLLNTKIVINHNRIPMKVFICGSNDILQVPVDPTSTLRIILEGNIPKMFKISRPFIQGVDCSSLIDEPLLKLWQLFKHLDNFLYVCMII